MSNILNKNNITKITDKNITHSIGGITHSIGGITHSIGGITHSIGGINSANILSLIKFS